MDAFYKSLKLMGQGMLGIFIVIFIIYIVIKILLKIFPPKNE